MTLDRDSHPRCGSVKFHVVLADATYVFHGFNRLGELVRLDSTACDARLRDKHHTHGRYEVLRAMSIEHAVHKDIPLPRTLAAR